MKKLKTLLVTMAVALTIPMTALAEPSNDLRFISMNNIVYYAKGKVTQTEANTVLAGYERLPEVVKYKLIANNIRVYIYPKDYEVQKTEVGEAVSIARSAGKAIYIDSKGNKTVTITAPGEVYIYTDTLSRTGDKTVIHEIGHIIDDLYDTTAETDYNASRSSKFIALADKYRVVIANYDEMSVQNAYNNHELYAECFRIMMENPGYLLANATDLYSYMTETITKI